jgi:hypothetical protein
MAKYNEYVGKTSKGGLFSSLCSDPRQAVRKIVMTQKFTLSYRVKVYDNERCFEYTVKYYPEGVPSTKKPKKGEYLGMKAHYLITQCKRTFPIKTELEDRGKLLKRMTEIDPKFTYPDHEWCYYDRLE